MNAIQFLIFTVVDLLGLIFILRIWFQLSRVDFYNPLSQSLVKFTQPVLAPLRTFIPTIKNVELSALFVALILFTIKLPLINFIGNNVFVINIATTLLIGAIELVRASGSAIIYALLIAAIMSWFNRGVTPLQIALQQLTQPLLRPIQRILPNTGMIDFSPMVLVFILLFLDRFLSDLFPIYALVARLG